MTAYGAATATTAAFDVIRDAATPGERDKPAKVTVQTYRDTLERLWILDPLPAWLPTSSHLRRLGSSPRHHLTDPALAARLLGVDAGALLEVGTAGPLTPRDGPLFGQLFESLVTLDVRVYAQAAEARVGHLRTHGGEHEVDLIVERGDHRILAIEVKLAHTVRDDDVRHQRASVSNDSPACPVARLRNEMALPSFPWACSSFVDRAPAGSGRLAPAGRG